MDVARNGPFCAFAGCLRARCSGCLQRLLLVVALARVPRSAVAVAQRQARPAGSRAQQRTAAGCSPAPHHATGATPASVAPPPRWPAGPGWRPLPAAGVRRRVLALRPVGRLPEAERRALVVDALGDQPVRLALGLVRVAAGRPDPLDGGRRPASCTGA